MWKSFRPNKNPTKIFKFINTRHNHLDITAQLGDNVRESINKGHYRELLKSLSKSKEYHVYNEFSIITQDKIYSVENEYNEIANEFEKVNEMKRFRLDDTNDNQKVMIDFIKTSCVFNATVDFQSTHRYRSPKGNLHIDDIDTYQEIFGDKIFNKIFNENSKEENKLFFDKQIKKNKVKQIDMSKAYTRCSDSPYFCGYPAKITDFRKCDRIMAPGFYLIKNIRNIPDTIKSLGVYFEDNVYPSPELEYIKSIGIQYDIIAGAWGTTCDIEWGPQTDNDDEYIGMFKKSNNCRNYAKWFGCSLRTKATTQFKYKTYDLDYIKNWKYEEGGNETIKYIQDYELDDKGEKDTSKPYYTVVLDIPKQNIYHRTHICSFIYGYQRIMMMQQLLKIPYDNIIRVCVDGIYYKDCDFEIMKNFSTDKNITFGNIAGGCYRNSNELSNQEDYYFKNIGENKEFNRKEVWTGAGGCGKTHQNYGRLVL